jgi:histone acetyltransferase (RNA polymerase elongator complex component)
MYKKHFNIPIFIPELACPFRCIYCDQSKISGITKLPDEGEISSTIDSYLATIPEPSEVQLAYFGGNFTGIPASQQEKYLKLVQPYIEQGKVQGIRLSTRPDYINDDVLRLLKRYHVQTIELGAQSLNNDVLRRSRRGHTSETTEIASKKIIESGFTLGLQMMIGLPGDTLERSLYTARRITELGAGETRIYPALVIKGTVLEKMFRENKYAPLSLEESIRWCAQILPVFEEAGVRILKVGLHPSDGFLSGDDLVAGPFHPSFRELVETHLWHDLLKFLTLKTGQVLEISVPARHLNYAIGYEGVNKKMLEKNFPEVIFTPSAKLSGRMFTHHVKE